MSQHSIKFSIIISIFLFSCAKGINKSFQTVKIHTKLPYSITTEKAVSTSFKPFDTSKYDTLTINRSANPISIKVLVGDSSQSLNISSKISPLLYLNLPATIIGTVGTPAMLRFGSPTFSLRYLVIGAFGYGSFLTDFKSNDRFTYPHNIYIYEQNNKAYTLPFDRKILSQRNALKISPLRIIDTYSPSFEFAFERKISKSISVQFLYGTMNKIPQLSIIDKSLKGNRIAYELRYYYKKTAPIGPFIALDHNRLVQSYNDILYFSRSDSSLNYNSYPDSVKISRRINSINFKIGYQYIQNHFLFDFGFGIGIRNKTLQHFERINEKDSSPKPFFYNRDESPGQIKQINLPITFKFGYSF